MLVRPPAALDRRAPDEELIGEWFDADQMDAGVIATIRKKAGNETVIEVLEADEDPQPLYCTKIGECRYWCQRIGEKTKDGYLIIRYEFRGRDEVHIRSLSGEKVSDAIRAGQVAGKTWSFFGKQARLTDTSEGIRAYLEKHGKECIDRDVELTLRRRTQD